MIWDFIVQFNPPFDPPKSALLGDKKVGTSDTLNSRYCAIVRLFEVTHLTMRAVFSQGLLKPVVRSEAILHNSRVD
jgi:hypothetical protein